MVNCKYRKDCDLPPVAKLSGWTDREIDRYCSECVRIAHPRDNNKDN